MTGLTALLIFVGLFFLGGAISFWKQQMPKGIIVLLGFAAFMSLLGGVMRLSVWT
ncbi:hypothetical protein LHJ74_31230 [Streptomyces sp. N2-109]|uniref:Amidotransferase n=1 Tax=Streptomyces gossypii TaxID=2883101 RepID=A0ABT2K2D7_9ACTN|nr:hypothetical protein [Streptomyces gossypii]MCT2594328.1 hypothetical protein [Streptomyces gossypii]